METSKKGSEQSINPEHRKMVKEILLKNKRFFIDAIQSYYPLSGDLLSKGNNLWHPKKRSVNNVFLHSEKPISYNPVIPLQRRRVEDVVERVQGRLDWEELSRNESLLWTEEVIEKHKDKWINDISLNWWGLSLNTALPWSVELIERYKDQWDWEGLSGNGSLPWSEELIDKYKNDWHWSMLSSNGSLPWSEELIEKYKTKWDWQELGLNEALPWTEGLIEKYKDEWWYWDEFGRGGLAGNKALPWSNILIERYKDEWDWGVLSEKRTFPWTEELIEKFKDKWKWDKLSSNESLPWSENLIERYQDKWDWDRLSENKNISWSEELIVRYKDEWYWKGGLSRNPYLPWSEELIRKYQDKWSWGVVTIRTADGEYDEVDGIFSNTGIKWNLQLLVDFISNYEYIQLNHRVWEVLKPFVDDDLIKEVLEGCGEEIFQDKNEEKLNKPYNNRRYLLENDVVDWSNYNDDLDPDQQSPDFWNQF